MSSPETIKSCQGEIFFFIKACGYCDRCEAEATAVLNVWGKTSILMIPDHIIGSVLMSMQILGAFKGKNFFIGVLREPSN